MPTLESAALPRVRTLGRYELFAKLGSGGMAEVHLARQRGLKRFRKLVVVKTVHPQLARDERFVDLLLDEARISALLKHPRVVDIYDVDEDDGVVFIAMEYLSGQSLTEIIKAGRRGRRLDPLSAARIIADAAEGLDAAHELRTHSGQHLELVHRDVSPGNIIVLYGGQVKLVDFGVAKARDHLSSTSSSTSISKFAGKLGYAAPEQLGSDDADRRSDVFSLGVVLWELICLRRLFPAKSREQALALVASGKAPAPSTIRDDSPPALDEVCLRALDPDPAKRFQTAKDMFREIEAVLVGADYRREQDLIATYMKEVFHDQRLDTEALVRRVSESTNQIAIAELAAEDAETLIDESLPDAMREALGVGLVRAYVEPTAVPASRTPEQSWVARLRAHLAADGPWRRPILYGIGAVVAVLLSVVVLEVATSGTRAPTTSDLSVTSENAESRTNAENSATSINSAVAVDDPSTARASSAAALPDAAPLANPEALAGLVDASVDEVGDIDGGGVGPDPPIATSVADASAPPVRRRTKPEKRGEPSVRDPELAAARYLEGTRALRSGKITLARKRLQAALDADSSYARAHRALGLVHSKAGNRRAAIRAYRNYLKLRPDAKDGERIRKSIAELQN